MLCQIVNKKERLIAERNVNGEDVKMYGAEWPAGYLVCTARHMLLILRTAFQFYAKHRTGYKC